MEIELKYACPDEAVLQSIFSEEAARGSAVRTIRMHTTYYDTPEHSLREKRWSLRLRRENDLIVANLKTDGMRSGALSEHGEWEAVTDQLPSAVSLWCAQGAPEELKSLAEHVAPVCSAAFIRKSTDIRLPDGSLVELSADSGYLAGATEQAPLCELEAELKSGSVDALLEYGQAIERRYGLLPECRSKLARALALN